jgi:hypothetical protein
MPQHDFILLDRSGSMESLWVEALSSINSYVKKLTDDKIDTGVTLAMFDADVGQLDFRIIRDRIIPSTWKPVTSVDAIPRGMPPSVTLPLESYILPKRATTTKLQLS